MKGITVILCCYNSAARLPRTLACLQAQVAPPVTDALAWPDWFEKYKDKYATGAPAPQSGDISYRGFVLGAG